MRKIWTSTEIDYMREHYADTPTQDIADVLVRSLSSVYGCAGILKLTKSEAFKQSEASGRMSSTRKISGGTEFKKGHVPHNKGKQMSPELYAKCEKSMFKKGNEPHNANYDGHERITKDGYVEVRIRKGKYVLKHRHEWENVNGPVPKNMILTFKDGIKTNTNPENMLLLSKAENMARNTIHRFPPELKHKIRLVNKLNRLINEKQSR